MTYKLLCFLLLYFYLTLMFNYRLLLLRSYTYKKYRVNSNSYIVRQYVPHSIIILAGTSHLWSHSSLHPYMLCQVLYLVLLFYSLYTKSKNPVCVTVHIRITYHPAVEHASPYSIGRVCNRFIMWETAKALLLLRI